MKKLLSLTLLCFLSNLCMLFSQTTGCGTYVQQKQIDLENTFTIPQSSAYQSLPQIKRILLIAFFIVKNENNIVDVTMANIDAAINQINQNFSPIGLNFKKSNVTTINNYQFDNLSAGQNELEIEKSFYEKNVINVYLVTNLIDTTLTAVNGLTYMPPIQKDYIFIKKSSLLGSNLSHQLGHYFDLYHTHETKLGAEKVTRPSNCTSAGDRCCDTPADPNISISGTVDNNCNYSGSGKDSDGVNYVPSAKNIMSSGSDNCRCFFSNTQFQRMIYALNHFRNNLR